jgi:PAS domain S-box-containing protein
MMLNASPLDPPVAIPSALAAELTQQCGTHYRDLVAGSLQGIGMLHEDGIIQFVNPVMATLFGYASPDDLSGRDVRTLFAPHEHAPWEEYRHACLQAPAAPRRHIVQGIRQDHSALWLEICLSSVSWQGLPALLVTCLDGTARRLLETQMRQSQTTHTLGALAVGIAHDFNNMLAAILGYTELVMDDVPRESLAWHRLQRVLTAGERAKDLVRQILMMSRQQKQERRPVQLRLLTQEVLKLLRASLPVTIVIHQHLDLHVGTVLADPTQIYQILMHLCMNAEHAMRLSGGVLEVGLDEVDVTEQMPSTDGALVPGPYVRLTVRDTGHGIPEEILDRIFAPCFTTKVPEEGTGMGLTVVQGIMRHHDGAIHVASLPDQGSTFTLYFPRFHKPIETSEPAVEPVPWSWG